MTRRVPDPWPYRALVIGINKYPGNPLQNCVHDAEDIAVTLHDLFSWNQGSGALIRLLCDERATAANIRERLAWVTQASKCALVYESGHGAQTASRADAGEVDGLTELFCPVDFSWSSEKTWLTDDEYAAFFGEMPDGSRGYFISDSCHSGDLSRAFRHDVFQGVPKHLEPPADIAWRVRMAREAGCEPTRATRRNPNLCAISACRSDQVAMDGSPGDGRGNGAFTWGLRTAWHIDSAAPMSSAVSTLNRALDARGYEQVSEIVGPADMVEARFPALPAAP